MRRLLTEGHGIEAAALVLQAEAARRLTGKPARRRCDAIAYRFDG